MEGRLQTMGKIAPKGWNLSAYEDFSEWLGELAGIHKSSALDKHRATLARIVVVVEDLFADLTDAEEMEPELPVVIKKGKGKKAAPPVEEEEETELYDLPVSVLIH